MLNISFYIVSHQHQLPYTNLSIFHVFDNLKLSIFRNRRETQFYAEGTKILPTKASTDYTKPRQTIQSPKKTIQSPKTLYKIFKKHTKPNHIDKNQKY